MKKLIKVIILTLPVLLFIYFLFYINEERENKKDQKEYDHIEEELWKTQTQIDKLIQDLILVNSVKIEDSRIVISLLNNSRKEIRKLGFEIVTNNTFGENLRFFYENDGSLGTTFNFYAKETIELIKPGEKTTLYYDIPKTMMKNYQNYQYRDNLDIFIKIHEVSFNDGKNYNSFFTNKNFNKNFYRNSVHQSHLDEKIIIIKELSKLLEGL